jgi:uncharacterized membrane protein YphA (DoxX/SURF4 family)
MKKVAFIARLILGLIFFMAGIVGLLQLAPPPPDMPEKLKVFMDGIMATTYFFPLLKTTETVCGLLLLTGFAPALALIILAPIMINILCVHAFLTPGLQNLALPIFMLAMHLLAASAYWPVYQPLFRKNKDL